MKARVTGAVLFGIGVLSLVVAAALAFAVTPRVSQLPYDLDKTTSVAEAPGATFLELSEANGARIEQADLRSTIEIVPRADLTADLEGDLDGEAVVWDAYQTVVRTDNDYEISMYQARLALDRETAAAADWDEQYLMDAPGTPVKGNVEFAGQTYKFPFGTEKKTYQYYDRDLREARPIEYQGTEEIEGLEVYRFQQVIEPTPARSVSDESLASLLGAFAPEADSGEMIYSNTRTLWVEPTTGLYIKVQEQQKKVLRPATGAETTLLDATFTYNDETIGKSADRASESRSQLLMIGRNGPIGLAVLGAILLIAGIWLVTRAGSRRRDAVHQPRHEARQEAPAGGAATDEPAAAAEQPAAAAEQPAEERDGTLADVLPPAVSPAPGGPPGIPKGGAKRGAKGTAKRDG